MQEDNHLPELTVRETFDFSGRCQGVGTRPGADGRHLGLAHLEDRPNVAL
jgi:ABC-type multidrug transport system ATPase subunit